MIFVPDLLRIVICVEAIAVGLLYLSTLVRTLRSHRASRTSFSKRIFWGRATRFAGIGAVICAVIIDRIEFFGDPIHPSTPLLQAAIILLAVSWHLIDRSVLVD